MHWQPAAKESTTCCCRPKNQPCKMHARNYLSESISKANKVSISFPTCQVRVVRFYQSCCPPPPPSPPPVSPRPCLHQLPPPLPPCQLFAKLFANFRAQCALLDLNTWGLPSSVRTAGPQPGTFPAQCAPLDLNLGPSQLSAHRWTSTGTFRAQCAPLDLNLGPSQLSAHRWTSTAR